MGGSVYPWWTPRPRDTLPVHLSKQDTVEIHQVCDELDRSNLEKWEILLCDCGQVMASLWAFASSSL